MKRAARAVLELTPYTVLRTESLEYLARYQEQDQGRLAVSIHALFHERILPDLPDTPEQAQLLRMLLGTSPVSGMFLLGALHKSLRVPGAVCEFGVAQGATSALVANELLHHAPDRTLWLYDSFEGLPPPTDKDVLVVDPLGLGNVESYAGRFAVPRREVEHRLAAIGWPRDHTRIIEGFFTRTSELPEQVALAYVDFDFYEPILSALNAIHSRSQVGTIVLVDDYGFFSAGAQTAVDEFAAASGDAWKLQPPPSYLDFATLERVS